MTTRIDNTNIGTLAELSVSGLFNLQQSTELIQNKTSATGTVSHDFSTGAIFYHSSIVANFTANITNVDTTNNRAKVVTLILNQGGTAYIPNSIQIDGSSQTINWTNGEEPTGNANKIDLVTFTMLRISSAWQVLGSFSSFG